MSGEESAAVLAARFSRLSFANHHDQATKPSGTSGRGRFVYETPLIDSPPAINKGERNAGRRIVLMPARKRRAGRATESAACAALRLRARSPAGIPLTVFTSGTFVPKAQRRARLPERRHKGADSAARAATSVTAMHLAPVLVLAGMMPEPPGSGVYLSARGCRTRS